MAFATTRIIDRGKHGQIIYEACLCEQHLQTDAPHDLSELEVTPIDPAAKVACTYERLAPEFRYAGYVDCAKVAAVLLFALLVTGCSRNPVAPSPVSDARYDGAFYKAFVLNNGQSRLWRPSNARVRIELGAQEADTLAAEAAARDVLSAFGHSPLVSRDDTTAGIVVRWAAGTGPDGACGAANPFARNVITLYPDSPGCRCAGGQLSATVVKHEIGHALGFYHTDDPADLMSPVWTLATCNKRPSERERIHATIADSRPIGDNTW